MELVLTQVQAEEIHIEAQDAAATELNELQLMLVGGGNVTVIVG